MGIKTAELRSISTTIIGERIYIIYACKAKAIPPVLIWLEDLRVGIPPAWMIELEEQVKLIEPGALLPTGVIVGSAVMPAKAIERLRVESAKLMMESGHFSAEEIAHKNGFRKSRATAAFVRPGIRTAAPGHSTHNRRVEHNQLIGQVGGS